MKTKNKVLVAIISSLLMTATSQANELDFLEESSSPAVLIDMSSAKASPKKEIKPVSVTSSTIKSKLSQYEAFIDPDLSAKRSQDISQKKHELSLKKINMQEAQISEEIAALEEKKNHRNVETILSEKQDEWDIEKQKIRDEYKAEKSALKYELQELRKMLKEKQEDDSVLKEKIFVTKIFGIGNNIKAQFYFENNIKELTVGEEIVPGAIAKRIDSNGVLVKYKGKEHFVSLTTMKHAHMRTFGVKEGELKPNYADAGFPMPPQPVPVF